MFTLFVLGACCGVLVCRGAVPALLHHQGRVLLDGRVMEGVGEFKFALVNADGSVLYWSNAPDVDPADGEPDKAVSLTLERGLYSVILGDASLSHMDPIPPGVFSHEEVYLRVWLNDGSGVFRRLLPDTRVVSVGYALMAATVPDGAITAEKLAPDALGNLPSQVQALSAQLADMQEQLDAQAALIASLQDLTTSQAAQIAALQAEVDALSPSGGAGLIEGLTAASVESDDPVLKELGFRRFSSLPAPAWRGGSSVGAPSPRSGHVAVWTGTSMIVWGGEIMPGRVVNTGAMYDPAADAWTSVSTVNAPAGRTHASAVWTGAEMVVWGGVAGGFLGSGGRFDPATQSWRPLPAGPAGRVGHVAVWTGSRLLIWGGRNAMGLLNDGAIWDPATDSWSPLPVEGRPAPRQDAAAVWAGDRLLVWGGEGVERVLGDGAALRFDGSGLPVDWTPLSAVGAPSARRGASAVWTGSQLLIWGGTDADGIPQGDGGAYDPATDTWTAIPPAEVAAPRRGQVALWTGSELVIVAGETATGATGWGAAYDPEAGRWRALTVEGGPLPRSEARGVWTGSELILFGGQVDGRRVAALQLLVPQPVWHLYRKQ